MFTQVLSVPQGKPNSEFGPRLRALREAKGLTLVALATMTGMRHQAVSRLERGEVEPKWSTVLKLAEALGVDVGEFRAQEP